MQGVVQLEADGTIRVLTNDFEWLGLHFVEISASLIDYPTVVTSQVTVLPVRLDRCAVELVEWEQSDVTVPPVSFAYASIVRPEF